MEKVMVGKCKVIVSFWVCPTCGHNNIGAQNEDIVECFFCHRLFQSKQEK